MKIDWGGYMKSRQKPIFITLLLIVCGILGCGDKNNPITGTSEFSIDKFPYEIGTVWKYQRVNNLTMHTDTLFIRINDTLRINSQLEYRIKMKYAQLFLSPYFNKEEWIFSGDTLSINAEPQLIFPLKVGSSWSTQNIDYEVITNESFSLLGNNYANTFQVESISIDSSLIIESQYRYAPNIGLIQFHEIQSDSNSIEDYSWNLISYHKPDKFELSQLPLQTGASWTYNVYNHLIDCTDSADCTDAADVTIVQGGSVLSKWLFEYQSKKIVYNSYLQDNTDILVLNWVNDEFYTPINILLRFPFSVGDSWEIDQSYSFQVLGLETIDTEAGSFEDAYYIRGLSFSNYSTRTTFKIWLVKDIGIVKFSFIISDSSDTFEEKTWELSSYDL